jgi:putative membrane protein
MGTAGADKAPVAAGMTDEQIAAVTNAANTGEVDQAKEAVKKARSAKVKQFAQHMVTDHGAAFKQQNDILKKANLTASDNPTSQQLQSDGKQVMAKLQSATGADFDRQYMDAQVKQHQQVLETLDNKLIPDAKNAELKSYLQTIRGKVADHLKSAQDILAGLK